jgi:hypothetical protein
MRFLIAVELDLENEAIPFTGTADIAGRTLDILRIE